MFYTSKVLNSIRAKMGSHKEGYRQKVGFEVPIFVKNKKGEFVERYGRVGFAGCCFESDEALSLSDYVDIKVFLHGLDVEVEARGKVVSIYRVGTYSSIGVLFENVSNETERHISNWLDYLLVSQKVSRQT
jgi:hypothetical protein